MIREIRVADDVYVRGPERFEPGCNSITGLVSAINGDQCEIAAYVARPWVKGVGSGSGEKTVTVPLSEVGHRIGTPISQLSGRPGHDGFSDFSRIARSWGYP